MYTQHSFLLIILQTVTIYNTDAQSTIFVQNIFHTSKYLASYAGDAEIQKKSVIIK